MTASLFALSSRMSSLRGLRFSAGAAGAGDGAVVGLDHESICYHGIDVVVDAWELYLSTNV